MIESRERWVHLYEFAAGLEPDGAWGMLSGEEQARARCIVDPVRGARFVARRAALREILAQYAGRPPAEVDLSRSGVCFSCSHSGDMAAVAVAPRPVGIDVEIETPRRGVDRIAARMFAPDERRVLEAVDGDLRRHLFHRCWVGKEAYAKGRGRGLGMRFHEFSVAAALCSPAETGTVNDPWGMGEEWTVALTTVGDRHLAVAATGCDWEPEWRAVPREEATVG
jgi:4'-phosphopantetheinyl transferase